MDYKYTDEELEFINNLNIWEVNFIQELKKKKPTLKYVGGYTGSENVVILECLICGEQIKRKASFIRGERITRFKCEGCKRIETNINRLEKQTQRIRKQKIKQLIDNYNKEHIKFINNINKELKRNTIYIKQCKECNKTIYTQYNNKTICDSCSKKHKYKSHSKKSLRELYVRDKGICHICGNKCDYEDYTYRGNTFIAGNYYPSIDHVTPLIKGGTDDWNNLKLAHRICNSLKRDKCLD